MYEALERIENLIIENTVCSEEQLQKLIKEVFAIAHQALREEDSNQEKNDLNFAKK